MPAWVCFEKGTKRWMSFEKQMVTVWQVARHLFLSLTTCEYPFVEHYFVLVDEYVEVFLPDLQDIFSKVWQDLMHRFVANHLFGSTWMKQMIYNSLMFHTQIWKDARCSESISLYNSVCYRPQLRRTYGNSASLYMTSTLARACWYTTTSLHSII